MTVRVHLADNHTMFRQGLEAILASRGGVEVVGSTSTGEDAASMVGRTRPDVIVTELDMQPRGGREIIEGLRAASPGLRIVVLTMIETTRHLKALSRLGIDAYLHKTSSAEELIATIDATVSRAPDDGSAVVSMPRGLLQTLTEGPVGGLSEREAEVVVLAARGLPNRLIPKEMHISEGTVKRHMANVYEKAGVHSRTEAVRKALMEQWIGIHEITSPSASGGGPGNRLREEPHGRHPAPRLFIGVRGKVRVWEKLMPPRGHVALPRRWVMERTFAWICHNRRMRKDYEGLRASAGHTRGRRDKQPARLTLGGASVCCALDAKLDVSPPEKPGV